MKRPKQMTAEQLKRARAKLRLTQPQLAEALGVNTWTVAAWEQGRQEPPAYLRLAFRELARKEKKE